MTFRRVLIGDEDWNQVKQFSEQVINETYNRFNKNLLTRFERIFIGKLGEVVFSLYLDSLNIPHSKKSMFEIYQGITNVDYYDFEIYNTKETIDIKTVYKSFHRRILIPSGQNGQWDQMPKDFYVGIKIENIVDNQGSLIIEHPENISAFVCGYAPRLSELWKGPSNFGEGPCMWVDLQELYPIEGLTSLML